jgi:photosystem II stability/assembly factor-like uncharacterized protein
MASRWTNVTSNLANMASECGNLGIVSAKPDEDMLIAGVARKGLFASRDGGMSWQPLGTGAGSAAITNRPASIVYDPEHPQVFWEAGIYNGGGVYRTDDAGKTFKQLGTIGHNDNVSVDFTDPARKTLLAGGHEQKRKLYRSNDGGATWMDIGATLPADSHFSSQPLVLDAQTFLLGACGYGDGHCGILRSTDAGATWKYVSDRSAAGAPLRTKNGTIFWSLVFNGGMVKSTDQGQTWTPAVSGRVLTARPFELPDGRVLTVGNTHVLISSDGVTWTQVGDPIGYMAAGVTYSVQRKALFVWRWDCGNAVPANGILTASFDAQGS